MNLQNTPIGVFDSGMGGLTVLRALRAALPNESFIYLGDTARLPYGTKSADTVKQYAVQMARILIEKRIKLLVIACNTATTAALSHLQAMLPDTPVIGVINPGAQAAVAASKNQRIAVIATETTIASQAYQQAILAMCPQAKITARTCGLLVALAEEGMADNAITHAAFDHYLAGFNEEDTLLLGCTHFPVFESYLKKRLPTSVNVVDSALATALAVKNVLHEKHLVNSDTTSEVRYLVTDSIQRFQAVGALFLGAPLDKQTIALIDI